MLNIIATKLLSMLEEELIKHSPEIEQALIRELSSVAETLVGYVTNKLEGKDEADSQSSE